MSVMWRSALRTCRRGTGSLKNTRAEWRGVRGCHGTGTPIAPAFPAGSVSALEAMELWTRCFEEGDVAEPDHSTRYITAHVLGAKTIESIQQERLTEHLSCEKAKQLWELCSRRLSRVPVQYVIEEWDFRDLTLKMRAPVFIPRPETEELVELVLADLQARRGSGTAAEAQHRCLEVGCGSGAISLSLLESFPQLRAVAVDRSEEAVALTRENARRLGLQDRLDVHHLDVMEDAETLLCLSRSISVVVSNPPYLFSEDMVLLEPEILRFEDHSALDGGADGLRVIRQILTLAPRILPIHGRVYLEVDPRHPQLIHQWVKERGSELRYVETRRDISGSPRFCILQRKS